jgi:hypothetical protein
LAKNDPTPMAIRIKMSLTRTTILAAGNPDNPKIASLKIDQQAEITRHNDKSQQEITSSRHSGTRLAND